MINRDEHRGWVACAFAAVLALAGAHGLSGCADPGFADADPTTRQTMANVELIRYYHVLNTHPETAEEPVVESSAVLAAGPPAAPQEEEAHSAARVIHVSSTRGSDSNWGTEDAPMRTIGKAVSRLRDGEADQLLLRRGDTWQSGSSDLGGYWRISGRDAQHPLVFGSYGDPADPLPVIELTDSHWLRPLNASYIRISGIRFYSPRHDPDSQRFDPKWAYDNHARPIRAQSDAHHLTIDGCVFDYAAMLYAQSGSSNLTVRNSVSFGSYQGPSHAMAIYAHASVSAMRIENNVIDRTGYNFAAAAALAALNDPDYEPRRFRPTHHNHGLYIQARDVTTRGNIIARSSSFGIQYRDGTGQGTVEDNLLLANGNGFFTSGVRPDGPWSTVRGNVVLHAGAHLIPDGFAVGSGSNTTGYSAHDTGSVVHRNILAHAPESRNALHRAQDADLSGNVVYDWGGEYDPPAQGADYPDPDRTIERYVADVLGVAVDSREHAIDVFMTGARVGAAGCDAASVIEWVRQGFAVSGGSALSGG